MRLVNFNTHFSVWKLAAKAKGGGGGGVLVKRAPCFTGKI